MSEPSPIPADGGTPPPVDPFPQPAAAPTYASAAVPAVPSSRSWEVACHLAALSGWFTGGLGWIGGPLIVWLLKKSELAGVDAHGRESLNFQISMLLYYIGFGIIMVAAALLTFGLGAILLFPFYGLMALMLLVCQLVLPVYAAFQASDGQLYRYPFTLRLLS